MFFPAERKLYPLSFDPFSNSIRAIRAACLNSGFDNLYVDLFFIKEGFVFDKHSKQLTS